MKILLVAPGMGTGTGGSDTRHLVGGIGHSAPLDTIPEIRALTSMHRVTVLNGTVTAQDVYNACRQEQRDIIHFAAHSDEYKVLLSGDETLDAEDIAQIARIARCRLVFFNSCRSARLATYAVAHGVQFAIATTVDIPDREAWKTPLSFYGYLHEQMAAVQDPLKVDIPAAFRGAVNGEGTYMLLTSIQRQSEIADLAAKMYQWRIETETETHAWRRRQQRMMILFFLQAAAGWFVLLILTVLHWWV